MIFAFCLQVITNSLIAKSCFFFLPPTIFYVPATTCSNSEPIYLHFTASPFYFSFLQLHLLTWLCSYFTCNPSVTLLLILDVNLFTESLTPIRLSVSSLIMQDTKMSRGTTRQKGSNVLLFISILCIILFLILTFILIMPFMSRFCCCPVANLNYLSFFHV